MTRTQSCYLFLALTLPLCFTACTSIERQAYRTFVSAKAFIDAERKVHPECGPQAVAPVCSALNRATAAKDLIIDAANVYCAGPQFDSTDLQLPSSAKLCQPAKKGTPAADQALAKLHAALAAYAQTEIDLKNALGGK